MELLEDIIQNSIRGKKRILTESEVYSYAVEDCNMFISALFNSLNKIIEEYPITNKFYNKEIFFYYLDVVREYFKDLDINFLRKKLTKTIARLDYIKKEKVKNKKQAKKNIEKFKTELYSYKEKIYNDDVDVENDFISYILEQPRDLRYINILFDKIPEVMKIKDNKGISLYMNIIHKSICCINEEEFEYYKKLILMMNSKNEFKISDNDKKKILLEIYNEINKLSGDKENRKKINLLKELKEIVITQGNQTDIFKIASKYNVDLRFDKEILDIIKNKKLEINKLRSGRKKIEDYVITIDGENAIEIDDALSCRKLENGNYLLGVHIASILGYFDYDSEIVQNAIKRDHSIYMHNKKELGNDNMIPIFPLEFSADFGSLVEGEDRLTRSYIFEIDNEGNIKHLEFLKTIVKNNKKATYEEINKILKKGCDDKELLTTVTNLKDVTKILSNKYRVNEVYEILKENSDNVSDLKVRRHGSEQIVYQAMLLTGNKVAEYFAKNNYPCLYRVHSVSEGMNEKIETIINNIVETYGKDQKEKLYHLVNGIYPKSSYDIEGSHFGLHLNNYCHCTSGLRRSADILVEHALEVCYDKEPTIEEIKELTEEINDKKEKINAKDQSLEWFVQDVNKTYSKRRHN